MSWYVTYIKSTGRPVSFGSIQPVEVPAEMAYVVLPEKPPDSKMWDEATKGFIDRPAKVLRDLLQELLDIPDVVSLLQSLTPAQRQKLRDAVISKFGEWRYQ